MTLLRWIPSVPASAFHAVSALIDGRQLTHPALQGALAEPAANLQRRLKSRLSGDAWFALLVEAGVMDAGGTEAAGPSATAAEVLAAFDRTVPEAAGELVLRTEPLREQWEARGPGLLHGTGKLTASESIVTDSDVLLLYPVLGGAGRTLRTPKAAVAIEAVLANPIPELPEVVRLGWLLAQLAVRQGLLPGHFSRERFAEVNRLAWLPAILTAAEDLELVRSADAVLPLAIQAWHLGPADPAILRAWWQRYRIDRPAWDVAVQDLDRQLE